MRRDETRREEKRREDTRRKDENEFRRVQYFFSTKDGRLAVEEPLVVFEFVDGRGEEVADDIDDGVGLFEGLDHWWIGVIKGT